MTILHRLEKMTAVQLWRPEYIASPTAQTFHLYIICVIFNDDRKFVKLKLFYKKSFKTDPHYHWPI